MPPVTPPASLGLTDRVLTFAVSLLVGGVALHAGAHVLADARDYGHAVVTALFGALAWALLEPIPLIGGAVAIVTWVAIVKRRYRLGWLRAAGVGIATWAAAVVVLAALELIGIGSVSALGVPGA
ncbi:hypothetical protein [Natrinema altunense]|uniref:Uncharacterized protein n=2 Tax=Natrinema altunense TaxID=222984 RepID=L9ZFY4_NATA2|nr:hypothetical protein [Natrinema altunense]ELY85375.1 hypothetical protein C485_12743 [Natrinema altunense JCM 12890]RZH67318.1 hypothetical protein ELS17_12850 [Natrinema altunense]